MASRHDGGDFVPTGVIKKLVMEEMIRITLSDGPLGLRAFSKLTSKQDWYSYACSKIPDLDRIFPKVKSTAKKSSVRAKSLKIEGNKAFELRQYEKAQELYTQSAAHAIPAHLDENGRNTLAISIANRSAALFFLGKYKECIIDIEIALQIGYPQDLKYKLYDRKGRCYQALKSYRVAEVAFELAAALLNKAVLEKVKKRTTLKQIQKNIEFCIRNQSTNVEVNLQDVKGELPKLSDTPNTTHPSLSAACKVEYRPGKGRCVVAAKDIKPGEVLLVEKPFASVFVPNAEYKDCCHHCFYPCLTLLPCLKCSTARYCSPECRDLSWETYHKYECGIPLDDLVGEGSVSHLALRIILMAGLDCLLEFHQRQNANCEEEIPQKFKGCNKEGRYLSWDYTTVYHLHTDESVDAVVYTACTAVFLTKLLEKMGFFDSIAREQKGTIMTCVGGYLIRHHLNRFRTIAHSIPSLYGIGQRVIVGIATHPTLDLFNYSCNLETSQTLYGSNVVLHSLQSFKQGQEITITNGVTFDNTAEDERQRILENEFQIFECPCAPCQHNWPLLQDISATPSFKCTHCEAPLGRPLIDFFQCPHCELIQSVQTKTKALRSLSRLLDIARKSDDVQLRFEYIEDIDKLLVQPWRDYVECKLELRCSLWQNGSLLSRLCRE